jgi:hypothetical protein
MKRLRSIAGLLLILDGIFHLASYLTALTRIGAGVHVRGGTGLIAFGILYLLTGAILFHKKKYSLFLGILIPAIGMTASFLKFGMPEILSLSALFKGLGILAIICCSYLIINQEK